MQKLYSRSAVVLLVMVLLIPLIATPSLAAPVVKIGSLTVPGNESSQLMLGVGAFDFNHRGPARYNHRATVFEGQYQIGKKWFGIGPLVGFMANTKGGYMGYAGLYTRFRYKQLVITPEFAVGGYERGDGKYLGGTLQFRPGISVDWLFHGGQRLGVRFAHISNGGIHHRNPSEQELMLTGAIPLP